MEHRHLLPEEIDLLLDGELGFGVAPLKSHVDRCERCRTELDAARLLVSELEQVPHLAPSPLFTEKVMAQVQVIEPVHIAAIQTARRWMPASRPMRVLAGAAAASVGFVLTLVSLWAVGNVEALIFFGEVVLERTRSALLAGLGSAIESTLGQPALDAVQTGGPLAMLGILTAILVAIAGAAFGLRALAGASGRSRSQG